MISEREYLLIFYHICIQMQSQVSHWSKVRAMNRRHLHDSKKKWSTKDNKIGRIMIQALELLRLVKRHILEKKNTTSSSELKKSSL